MIFVWEFWESIVCGFEA